MEHTTDYLWKAARIVVRIASSALQIYKDTGTLIELTVNLVGEAVEPHDEL